MDSRAIASLLKNTRESRRLTLQNAADRTRIKMTYLKAMEEGNLSEFGADVYARNFVRTYARFLRIAEDQILPLLEESPETRTDESDQPPEPGPAPAETPTRSGSSSALLVVAGVLAVAGGMYLFKNGFFRAPDSAAPPTGESATEATPAADAGRMDETSVDSRHAAELRALADVWTFWEADGKGEEKILSAGEVVNIRFSNRLQIRIGNTNGLTFLLDGREISVKTVKVYDRIFQVLEDGTLADEAPKARDLQRFRAKQEFPE